MRFVPGCCHCSTGITGSVTGCDGLAFAGATIAFKQSGTTIATFTSDSSGNYSGTLAAGTYDRVVTEGSGRFAAKTTTGVVVTGVAQSFTDGLLAATGYHCCTQCPLPLADTFDMADSLFAGNHPMTYNAGQKRWASASYGGFVAILTDSQNTLTGPGLFIYGPGAGQLNTTLTAHNCTPPIGLTFTATSTSGPSFGRTFTITNA